MLSLTFRSVAARLRQLKQGGATCDFKDDTAVLLETSDGPVSVRVLEIRGNKVRLGFSAPKAVTVLRSEMSGEVQQRIASAERNAQKKGAA
jgi:carbon storage regulator CsrA